MMTLGGLWRPCGRRYCRLGRIAVEPRMAEGPLNGWQVIAQAIARVLAQSSDHRTGVTNR